MYFINWAIVLLCTVTLNLEAYSEKSENIVDDTEIEIDVDLEAESDKINTNLNGNEVHKLETKKETPVDFDLELSTKFIITSTRVDEKGGAELMTKYRQLNSRIKEGLGCIRLDLYIPSEYDPILICLQPLDWSTSIFHRNFSLIQHLSDGQIKVTTLSELKDENKLVTGFVASFGFGHSYIQGQIKNGSFYGTVLFSQTGQSGFKMCSVTPLSVLRQFLQREIGAFDEDELEELLKNRIRISRPGLNQEQISRLSIEDFYARNDNDDVDVNNAKVIDELTSIVTCEGTRVNRFFNKNLDLKSLTKRKRKRRSNSNFRDDDEDTVGRILLSENKNYKYLTVYFYVDPRVIRDQFGNDASQMMVALSSYVEMTDWITRAHDFTGDGIPDNFGFKFAQAEVAIKEYKAKEIGPDIYKRLRRFQMENFYEELVTSNHTKTQSVNIAIVPIENPLYLHLAMNSHHQFLYEGCTACSTADILDGLINPMAQRYEWNGEVIRMMYATMHILIASMVHTESDRSCMDCTDRDQWVEADGGDAWGACLVEGMLFDSSNIPLNAFKLSKCTGKAGLECITDLGGRKINAVEEDAAETCIKMESEVGYCGNGIVEPGEECDCGTLATCDVDKCACGPRNGVRPCMKLTSTEGQLCQDLIKCRGFRFIYEMGQMNGSHFLASIPDLLHSRVLPGQGMTMKPMESLGISSIIVLFVVTRILYGWSDCNMGILL